ncbi:hypothetical protein UlMin_007828 [Ulmus minor]
MNSLLPLIQLFLLLIPFCLLISKMKQNRNKNGEAKGLPPGPMKLPLIGNLHQLGNLPHRSLQVLAEQHGPIMFLKLGSIPTLVVSSADIAREIFKTYDVIFSERPVLYAAKKLSYNCSAMSFSPYGEYWREIKKIMMLELLGGKRVRTFQAVRDEEVGVLIEKIACSSDNNVNLSELTLSLSNSVICRVAFGKKYDEDGDEEDVNGRKSRFQEILQETQELLGGFCLSDFFPSLSWINKFNGLEARLDKCFRELDSFYDKVIEEHLDLKRVKDDEEEDFVDVLLRVQKDPNKTISLTNDQIKGVITDIFIAGTDTSAATLGWIMAELIKNPSAMKRAQDEVRTIAKGKGKVEESDLSKLKYLKSVIKEGFRLHPPVPLLVPRETTESFRIKGYLIPPKTRVFVNAKMIGNDPKFWENPNEFKPERFLESSVDYKGQHFELLPFGAGRRRCPGLNFAELLVELALANLLCRFDWKLPNGVEREDLDMEEAFGLTMHKRVPLRLEAVVVDP